MVVAILYVSDGVSSLDDGASVDFAAGAGVYVAQVAGNFAVALGIASVFGSGSQRQRSLYRLQRRCGRVCDLASLTLALLVLGVPAYRPARFLTMALMPLKLVM